MNTFLWTVAAIGATNTVCIMWILFMNGELPPVTRGARLLDALVTLALATWAITLLGRGAA